jgi:hypothetical protein
LCFSLVSIGAVTTASAQEPPPEADWSLSAGVSVGSTGLGPPVLGTGLGGAAAAPGGLLTLERRVLERGWWTLRGSFQVSHVDANQGPGATSTAIDLLTGLRLALTGADPIELSIFALAGPTYGRSTAGSSAEFTGIGVFGQLGISVERRLVDSLSLRLLTPILETRWSHSYGTAASSDGSLAHVRVDTFFASAVLAPSLELRFLF